MTCSFSSPCDSVCDSRSFVSSSDNAASFASRAAFASFVDSSSDSFAASASVREVTCSFSSPCDSVCDSRSFVSSSDNAASFASRAAFASFVDSSSDSFAARASVREVTCSFSSPCDCSATAAKSTVDEALAAKEFALESTNEAKAALEAKEAALSEELTKLRESHTESQGELNEQVTSLTDALAAKESELESTNEGKVALEAKEAALSEELTKLRESHTESQGELNEQLIALTAAKSTVDEALAAKESELESTNEAKAALEAKEAALSEELTLLVQFALRFGVRLTQLRQLLRQRSLLRFEGSLRFVRRLELGLLRGKAASVREVTCSFSSPCDSVCDSRSFVSSSDNAASFASRAAFASFVDSSSDSFAAKERRSER